MGYTFNDLLPVRMYLEALNLAKSGAFEEALRLTDTLIKLDKKPEYLLFKGKILVHMENIKEAMSVFLEIPENSQLYEEAQKACRKIEEMTGNKRFSVNTVRKFISRNGIFVSFMGGILLFFLMLILLFRITNFGHSVDSISGKTNEQNMLITAKIDSLYLEIRKMNTIAIKIDSLYSGLKSSKVFTMDYRLKSLKNQVRKLKKQVDTLSIKNKQIQK
jgi:tetratricopeptide (TPR) repeat protein